MFTELDSQSANPWDNNTAEVSAMQRQRQNEPISNGLRFCSAIAGKRLCTLFNLFLKYKKNVTRITFWGVNDRQSG
jgi:endo-1,4-beta-xylanase